MLKPKTLWYDGTTHLMMWQVNPQTTFPHGQHASGSTPRQ